VLRFAFQVGEVVLLSSLAVSAQTRPSTLPDAPSAVDRRYHVSVSQKEVLASDPYEPMTKSQKRDYWLRQTYAPATFGSAAFDTAFTAATGGFRFCCGAEAWGKQYAAMLANKEARIFFGRFLFPTLLKQDPRYFPKREGSVMSRAWYAATRVVVTRNDQGRSTVNTSEFLSVAFSKALCNAYYPERDRTWPKTAARIYGTLQSDAVDNLLTEFGPDIKRIFKRHTPKRIAGVAAKASFTHSKSEAAPP
jgi:hypothetical protein